MRGRVLEKGAFSCVAQLICHKTTMIGVSPYLAAKLRRLEGNSPTRPAKLAHSIGMFLKHVGSSCAGLHSIHPHLTMNRQLKVAAVRHGRGILRPHAWSEEYSRGKQVSI